jgi:hypothetical protein
MAKLTRQNRKLRSTLRSKSPHPSRRRKQASGSEGEEESEEEEEESEEESEESGNESESTEPMSSEEEGSSRRSRGRSASRRTAKSKGRGKGRAKSKSRSKFMMSVQRTGIEGEEDSFEEKGENEENFASSEKLLVEIDNEYKAVLDATRDTLLDKIKKLKEVQGMATDWFDETGSLGVENQVEGAIGALEIQLLEMDVKLQELAESQREREQKGEEESKENDPPNEGEQNEMFWHQRCLESVECILMHKEEVLKQEFERDCAKEWNRRKLERVYAIVDGEGFGRDGIYRQDRNGCMEMYVGEFDDDPPGERSMRELWEEYVGGEMPDDLLKKERLDKEIMQIGKHEHLKQLEESQELERSGPTFRMMRRGKPAERREWWEEYFFSKGGSGEDPEPSITFGEIENPNEAQGEEESKSEEFDEVEEEESPKDLVIAGQNLRTREQWLKNEMAKVGEDLSDQKVIDEIDQVTLEVGKIESKLQEMGMGSRGSNDSSKKSKSEPEGMPKGETKSEDAEKKQVVSYASTLMKSVKKEDGSRDPSFQKAIEESAKALMEQREKEKQQEEIGEAIYQSIVELSKEEIEDPPSYEEEEAVREVKAVSLKLLQSEERKKELEKKEKQVEEEEAILRSVQDASKKTAAEELLKVHIDAAVKASTEELKLQLRREVVREVVVPMKLKEISKECAEAQALSKALNEEMAKVEEKRRKAKANAASLTERMPLRITGKKPQPLMGVQKARH